MIFVIVFIVAAYFLSLLSATVTQILPLGWEAHVSPDNKVYYHNSKLDISQWERPAIELKASTELTLSPSEMEKGAQDNSELFNSQIKVYKNYFKATEPVNSNSVTLALQMDLNRLERLEKRAKRWNGPISAAVLIHASSIEDFKRYVSSLSGDFKKKVSIHMCTSTSRWRHYPINFMRNVAMENVASQWTMILDSDEDPVFQMSDYRNEVNRAIQSHPNLNIAKTVFAVTSWQWATETKGHFPSSFFALKNMYNSRVIDVKAFHYIQAYQPANIPAKKWIYSQKSEFTRYKDGYEPYYIIRTGVAPKFDTRFRGWGGNKSYQEITMAAQKFKFLVLPAVFTFVDDTPKDALAHPPPVDPNLFVQAWKELGTKYGCNACNIDSCVANCPWIAGDEKGWAALAAKSETVEKTEELKEEKESIEPKDIKLLLKPVSNKLPIPAKATASKATAATSKTQ